VWEPGWFDGEQWVEGFWRPAARGGFTWVSAWFDPQGVHHAGYWEPTVAQRGRVWVPGYWDGRTWVEGAWVQVT
jgi:hypothetical protein